MCDYWAWIILFHSDLYEKHNKQSDIIFINWPNCAKSWTNHSKSDSTSPNKSAARKNASTSSKKEWNCSKHKSREISKRSVKSSVKSFTCLDQHSKLIESWLFTRSTKRQQNNTNDNSKNKKRPQWISKNFRNKKFFSSKRSNSWSCFNNLKIRKTNQNRMRKSTKFDSETSFLLV